VSTDERTRTWADRDLRLLNVRDFLEEAARDAANETFLLSGEERVTYEEFNRQTDAAASAWHRVGVRKGDRVAFMLENRPEFLQAWFGLVKIGGVLVAINTRWLSAEVTSFVKLTEPRFALVGQQFEEVFQRSLSQASSIERTLSVGPGSGFDDFLALVDAPLESLPRVELEADDPISFISTSGTTGRPKAVVQTHGNYVLTGEGYMTWVDLRRGERIYCCLPLFHINSQAYTVMGAIAARASIVLVERFSASRFWSDMAKYRVNVFNYIGSMLAILLKRDPSPEERGHSVRVTYGGPAPNGDQREEIERRFNLTLISGIGMSETTFGLMEPLYGEHRPGSLGKPRQHPDPRISNEARVVDDDGREVSPGEVGELIFRSPVMMKCYYRDLEQTAATIRDGWLYTGDLVRQDTDGFFYYVDRKKDIVRVRGENVSSSEVEQVLTQHNSVQEAAVLGVPSELTEEDVAAFVVRSADVGAREITDWCAARLAAFKVPKHVWFVEELPKTETLRVEKHRLKRRAAELMADSETALTGGSS
jgi:crotonobetaine/carnitine-CoA ligase